MRMYIFYKHQLANRIIWFDFGVPRLKNPPDVAMGYGNPCRCLG